MINIRPVMAARAAYASLIVITGATEVNAYPTSGGHHKITGASVFCELDGPPTFVFDTTEGLPDSANDALQAVITETGLLAALKDKAESECKGTTGTEINTTVALRPLIDATNHALRKLPKFAK